MKIKSFTVSLFTTVILCFFGVSAFAQKSEINRIEVFAGYSYDRVSSPYASEDLQHIDTIIGGTNLNTNLGKSYGMTGGEFSITGNFSKYVGATFDFSTHRNTRSFTAGTSNITQKYTLSNFLGGIQIKNNKKDGPVAKPFFHALVGVARQDVKLTGLAGTLATFFGASQLSEKQTNFAFAVGGGLDVKAHKHVDIRVIQVDYNPTYIKETEDFSSKYQGNVRLSFGIVIH